MTGDAARKRRRIYDMFSGHCFYCFRKMPYVTDKIVTKDHVIPKVHGGINAMRNLVLCCQPCNTDRGHISASRYLHKHCPFLTFELCCTIVMNEENRLLFHNLRIEDFNARLIVV